MSGVDLNARYSFEAAGGAFSIGANASYIIKIDQSVSSTAPVNDIVATRGNPLDLRARGEITYQRGGLSAAAFVNYDDSYRDNIQNRPIKSLTTIDLNIAYEIPQSGVTFAFNVLNLFDTDPPFVDNGLGYDVANSNALGRFVSLSISKRW